MAETSPPTPHTIDDKHRWISIVMLAFVFYYAMRIFTTPTVEQISYTQFIESVTSDEVASILIRGEDIKGFYSATTSNSTASAFDFHVVVPQLEGDRLLQLLQQHNVIINVQADELPFWAQLVSGFLPWLLIIGFFLWSSRALQARMGGNSGSGIYGFGRSRAKRFNPSETGPRYDDIAGLASAKQDLSEVVDYLKHPDKFRAVGAHMPKGILMMGAPGTGKTMLAKATANEAGVPFYSVSGSEFVEMYVGVGASRVRDMFSNARKDAPALIFIDEIDSVGRLRGTGVGGGNDEREQTLNQILAEMDGFEPDEAVIVLAATNRPDVLDPALMRPGRFDRKVILDLPQRQARTDILAVHTAHKPLADDVDLEAIAAATPGFSGADLANIANEAALKAASDNRAVISDDDFKNARDKVMMGAERKDLLNPSERKRIACHEAGHALLAYLLPNSDPLQKVSIVPHGQALGITEQIPVEDRHNANEDYLQTRLVIFMGGRCAEKLIFGNVSTGASDDLKQATKLANKMVGQWGMSRKLGPVAYNISDEQPFLGKDITEAKEFSEATAELIDAEVRQRLLEAETTSNHLLVKYQTQLEALLSELLSKETLYRDEIAALIGIEANTTQTP